MRTNTDIIIRTVSLILFVVALCVAVMLFTKKYGCPGAIPEGKVLIDQSFLDSLKVVANRPPDTVQTEMIIIDTVIHTIVRNNPTPYYIDLPSNERIYVDSMEMIDDGINAWVTIKTKGVIEQLVWGYTPVYKTITQEITVPEPYPVELFIDRPQRGLFLEGGMGWGNAVPGFSLGVKWQQRNGITYGAEMIQYDYRYYMIKLGYKIF